MSLIRVLQGTALGVRQNYRTACTLPAVRKPVDFPANSLFVCLLRPYPHECHIRNSCNLRASSSRAPKLPTMTESGCGCSVKEFLQNLPGFIVAHVLAVFWATVMMGRLLLRQITGKSSPSIPSKTRLAPAILNDPKFGQHSFLKLKSGIKIHYVESGPADKPLMLFVHGFPDFWFGWRHQIPYFNKNYRVVAIDLRGYGDSDKPSSVYEYDLPKLVEDIKQFIEGYGRKSCILVCHDWGAIIGWTVATVHPELVDRFIALNCPHPEAYQKYLRRNFTQFLKSWYVFLYQLPYLAENRLAKNDMAQLEASFTRPPMGAKAGTFSQADIEALKYTFGKPGAFTPPINYYRNIFRLFPSKPPVWRHLPMPVLVIFGTGDQALSTDAAVMSTDWVDGYFEVELLEGISHWVQHEDPKRVNAAMESFLNKDIPPQYKTN